MENELEALARKLSPAVLNFAREYIRRVKEVQTGKITQSALYMECFANVKKETTAHVNASRLMRSGEPCRMYIDSVLQQHKTPDTASLDEIRGYLTKQVRGVEELLDEVLFEQIYQRINKETGEVTGFAQGRFILSLDDIPQHLIRYVEGAQYNESVGAFQVYVKGEEATKDRNKAAEMLVRMQGGFIDKQEVSGPGGGPILSAVSNVSPDELKELARGLLDKL